MLKPARGQRVQPRLGLADRLAAARAPTPRRARAARPRPWRRGTRPRAGATSSLELLAARVVGQHGLVRVEDVEERLGREQAQLAERLASRRRHRRGSARCRGPHGGLGAASTGTSVLAACALPSAGAGQRLLEGLQVGEDQLGRIVSMSTRGRRARRRARRRGRRRPGRPGRSRRTRGCWPGTCCPAPRPRTRPSRCRRCRRTRRSRARPAPTRTSRASTSQARVRHGDDADVRLDRGERVVRGQHVVAGQRVEQRRLADVGQPDDAEGERHEIPG